MIFQGGGGPDPLSPPPSGSAHGLGQNVPFMDFRDFAKEVFFLCNADLVSNMRVNIKYAFEINMIIILMNMLNIRTYIFK